MAPKPIRCDRSAEPRVNSKLNWVWPPNPIIVILSSFVFEEFGDQARDCSKITFISTWGNQKNQTEVNWVQGKSFLICVVPENSIKSNLGIFRGPESAGSLIQSLVSHHKIQENQAVFDSHKRKKKKSHTYTALKQWRVKNPSTTCKWWCDLGPAGLRILARKVLIYGSETEKVLRASVSYWVQCMVMIYVPHNTFYLGSNARRGKKKKRIYKAIWYVY